MIRKYSTLNSRQISVFHVSPPKLHYFPFSSLVLSCFRSSSKPLTASCFSSPGAHRSHCLLLLISQSCLKPTTVSRSFLKHIKASNRFMLLIFSELIKATDRLMFLNSELIEATYFVFLIFWTRVTSVLYLELSGATNRCLLLLLRTCVSFLLYSESLDAL